MKNYRDNILFAVSIGFYFLLWQILNPVLGYMLDSDCVAYLTIAERVAKGDYFKSINGLWSPLNGWLLVPFIKAGFNSWDVAKAMNCFFGGIVIVLSQILFWKFSKNVFSKWLFAFSLPIMICYFVFVQMFGDVMQLIFVLGYLLLLFTDNYFESKFKIFFSTILMAIGYYAKAYSLVFFILHFCIVLFWFYKQQNKSTSATIKNAILGIVTSIIFVLPWSFQLQKKYNEFSLTGMAGKMNMSWYINSGKTFKEDITLLIPPSYNDSPTFWEDPYLSQTNLSSPFSSAKHFVKWIARVVYTSLESIQCFHELTFFAIAILLVGFYFYFFKKEENQTNRLNIQLLLITIMLLPIGYLAMHIETRYIWLNAILLWIVGFVLLEKLQLLNNKIFKIAALLLAFSFCYFPLIQIKNLKFKNKDLFETSNELMKQNWQGKFTSNVTDAGRMWVIAYLTKSQFYTIERTDYNESDLILEMKRYGVKYYFYEAENNKIKHSLDENYFKKINQIGNLEIYEKLNNE